MGPTRQRVGPKLLVGCGGEWVGGTGVRNYGLDPLLKGRTTEQDTVSAGEATDAYVGPHAGDFPLIAAARVGFAHVDHVSDGELPEHILAPTAGPFQTGIR